MQELKGYKLQVALELIGAARIQAIRQFRQEIKQTRRLTWTIS